MGHSFWNTLNTEQGPTIKYYCIQFGYGVRSEMWCVIYSFADYCLYGSRMTYSYHSFFLISTNTKHISTCVYMYAYM